MSVVNQLNKWLTDKTLIRITTLEKGKARQIYVGNIIFVDEQGSNILFYDLDQKKNYNISISEIEDVQPYQSRAKQIIESNIAKATKLNKENKLNMVSEKDKSEPKRPLPRILVCPVGSKSEEKIKENIRDEVIALIQCMPSNELYALYPLLQMLAYRQIDDEQK